MKSKPPPKPSAPRRVALVLSGGGARGAYEVGVLWYVFDELTRLRGAPPRIDILSGTSVGAVNACYLAAHLADPVLGMRRLVELWTTVEISRVLGFGPTQLLNIPRVLLGGGGDGKGVFDAQPMKDLVHREISWRALSRCLRRQQLCALSISATEVSTGRTVVFIQTSPEWATPAAPPRCVYRAERIGPQHALASAAIPVLFPPVRIGNELFVDGGLRQNTPISPALRLGATHVFAIGTSREIRGDDVREGRPRSVDAPGASFLLGKLLNAFLLDHVDTDIDHLERLNNVITDGTKVYGANFAERMSEAARKRDAPSYRLVESFVIRPSEDIGRLAASHVRRGRFRGNPIIGKRFFSMLDLGSATESDIASYLLFDGQFCRQLIEMGRADAQAQRVSLQEFFGDAGREDADAQIPVAPRSYPLEPPADDD